MSQFIVPATLSLPLPLNRKNTYKQLGTLSGEYFKELYTAILWLNRKSLNPKPLQFVWMMPIFQN